MVGMPLSSHEGEWNSWEGRPGISDEGAGVSSLVCSRGAALEYQEWPAVGCPNHPNDKYPIVQTPAELS